MADNIAVIFDFDDTLVHDSTTFLYNEYGIDTKDLWKNQYMALIQNGYDSALAYLTLLLDNIGEDKPLGLLTNNDLKEFGKKLDSMFYPGLPEILDDMKKIVEEFSPHISIEFYIISGGLQDLICGSEIVNKHFTDCYGCLLDESGTPSRITTIKRAINFTEKTRYIFELNKGIPQKETLKNPYLVNKHVPSEKRRIQIENMIYVGDGYSDIPCFSLLKTYNAISFGILHEDDKKTRKAIVDFLEPHRVASIHSPDYTKGSDLYRLLTGRVSVLCNNIIIRGQSAY